MCYYKQDKALKSELEERYKASLGEIPYQPLYYENGFDFGPSPIITAENPATFQSFNWGLIPWWVKSKEEAEQIRTRTLNCISEEMFTKPAFRDSIKSGKRCLIPCTGFFEWRWFKNGKVKYPYFIHMTGKPIFSLGGLYSTWVDRSTGEEVSTYAVMTTRANPLMEKIHNSKKRMPVILPREYEGDWLNTNLTKEDVLAFCEPLPEGVLTAHTISKMITDRRVDNKNVPEVSAPFTYPEMALLD
jgi:putative SOS response-associated peptidase YedK